MAAQPNGGLSRVNLLVAARNLEMTAPFLAEGVRFNLDRNRDAHAVEASQMTRYNTARQGFEAVDALLDVTGATPPCSWSQTGLPCR